MKYIKVYEPGDLLTTDEAAEHFGYSRDHFRNMLNIKDKVADPRLIRLKIDTDETWRKSTGNRARFVFEYAALKSWYESRQRRPGVKANAHGRKHEPNPYL